jgi:hypothetical protein
MPDPDQPYRVERIQTASGPAWRLVGPGLEDPKAYPWAEFRDKLEELARVMNFAWRQSGSHQNAGRDRLA